MNKQRRKAIDEIQGKLMDLQSELECVRDEEQEAFDNLPESIQYSERGERMEEFIQYLEESMDNLESAIESLDSGNFE